MSIFTIDDKTMHYIDKGEGPVLVFGHSFLFDKEMWKPQISVLAQNYRCIVPDLWSHGDSDSAPSDTNNLQDYAKDILTLLDSLKVDTFSLIGLSVGGMWATELTTMVPKRVKSLVLMDTFVGLEPEVTHAKYFAMLDLIKDLQKVPQVLIEQVTPMFFTKDVEQTNPELSHNLSKNLASLEGQKAIDTAQIGRMIFGRRDAFDELYKFALPTLIMVGDQDLPRPPLEAQLMQDAISGSKLILVPNAGHISNLEQPGFVTDKLVTFLKSVYG